MKSTSAIALDGFCNAIIGVFEVYSIASGEALTKPMSFSKAFDEMDRIMHAEGTGNGIDIRRVR